MKRALRSILAVIFVVVIVFAAITVFQNLGRRVRIDLTENNLYTLSDGTKSVLRKLNQPVKVRLYYAKTAVLKSQDWIERWHNHYLYVKDLLEEYAAASGGKIEFEDIDPRPFSQEEQEARDARLNLFPLPGRDDFFVFGLTVQSEHGMVKSIEYLDPQRERLIEYDVTSLIDAVITREKERIGILSSLPVFGGYPQPMMPMPGQRPMPAWSIVSHLMEQYDVRQVSPDTDSIEDVDVLLIIHPKDLPERTLFAIDQFVLNGGRAVVLIDPFCYADPPPQFQAFPQAAAQHDAGSNLRPLLESWGLEMPDGLVVGDYKLSVEVPLRYGQRPEKLITLLTLEANCMRQDEAITAQLSEVTVLAAGALREKWRLEGVKLVPLIHTTDGGRAFAPASQLDMMMPNAEALMGSFNAGAEPVEQGDKTVAMGYLVAGRPKSAYPKGIDIENEVGEQDGEPPSTQPATLPSSMPATQPATAPAPKRKTGLKEAKENCAVVVISDVDFISDRWAYRRIPELDLTTVVGDNAFLLLNAIDVLRGSSELISIRSRGSYKRPFEVVDELEKQAEKKTAEKFAKLEDEISRLQAQLKREHSEGKDEKFLRKSEAEKRREIQAKLLNTQQELLEVQKERREEIDALGTALRFYNVVSAPALILLIAIELAVYRSIKRRRAVRRLARPQ